MSGRGTEKDPSVSISLVSETNALLFTPMLAEVAGSSLEPSHISTPLRTTLHRTEFVRGRVASWTWRTSELSLDAGNGRKVAERTDVRSSWSSRLGAVSNYLGLTNVQKLAFDFKSLIDAIRIRNHVIEMFERADRERDPAGAQVAADVRHCGRRICRRRAGWRGQRFRPRHSG